MCIEALKNIENVRLLVRETYHKPAQTCHKGLQSQIGQKILLAQNIYVVKAFFFPKKQ